VERKHRHIVETGLTLLAHCSAPLTYWAEAFQTACYLINRLPTPILNNESPFQKLFSLRPNYNFLRIFGCACWPHLRPYNKHKLDFRSDTCIFIGYSPSHHGYKCLHPSTGWIYISRHVIFDESIYPFTTKSSLPQVPSATSHTTIFPPFTNSSNPIRVSTSPCDAPVTTATPSPDPPSPPTSHTPTLTNTGSFFDSLQVLVHTPASASHMPQPGRAMQTRSKNNIFKPMSLPDGFIHYPLPKALLAIATPDEVEPTCYSQAAKHPAWRDAMNSEFDALLHNGTWTLIPLTSTMNIVGCKWVFSSQTKS
jgi:hypothetical protein